VYFTHLQHEAFYLLRSRTASLIYLTIGISPGSSAIVAVVYLL